MVKKPVFILAVVTLVIALAGGIFLYMEKQKEELVREEAKKEFWEKQKPRIETFFRYNYNDIQSFEYVEMDENPMGISIRGYVNDDKKLEFTASVVGYEEEFNSSTIVSPELGALRKSTSYVKPVDEIEKEQQENN